MKIYNLRQYRVHIPGCPALDFLGIDKLFRTLFGTSADGMDALYDELEDKGVAVRGSYRIRVVTD